MKLHDEMIAVGDRAVAAARELLLLNSRKKNAILQAMADELDARKTALREAKMKNVETIAIVDSNCDPNLVDYAIPMNDDASKALEYVLGLMKDVILEGKGVKAVSDKKQAEKLEKEAKKN